VIWQRGRFRQRSRLSSLIGAIWYRRGVWWRGAEAHVGLVVAHVEIEVGKELLLGQGISRVNAEIGERPGRANPRRTAHLDAPPDAQAIGQAGLTPGGHVEIALALELRPEGVPQCGPGHLPGAGARRGIVGPGKVGPGAALGQVVPGPQPGALERWRP
jgi:hypothetical protein